MTIARHEFLRDPLILYRRLEHHACRELIDHRALNFLPGCLAWRIMIAAVLVSTRHAAAASSAAGTSMSALPLFRSMRTRSPVRSKASPPPSAASGEALRIDGEPEVPDWRPSPMQGSDVTPRLISAGRRLHVDDLGRARIADRPGAANEQDSAFVDAERGIVDAPVVVLRTVEHDGAAFKRIRVLRVGQVALAKLLGDHAGFHDRGIEQIAAQYLEARLRL